MSSSRSNNNWRERGDDKRRVVTITLAKMGAKWKRKDPNSPGLASQKMPASSRSRLEETFPPSLSDPMESFPNFAATCAILECALSGKPYYRWPASKLLSGSITSSSRPPPSRESPASNRASAPSLPKPHHPGGVGKYKGLPHLASLSQNPLPSGRHSTRDPSPMDEDEVVHAPLDGEQASRLIRLKAGLEPATEHSKVKGKEPLPEYEEVFLRPRVDDPCSYEELSPHPSDSTPKGTLTFFLSGRSAIPLLDERPTLKLASFTALVDDRRAFLYKTISGAREMLPTIRHLDNEHAYSDASLVSIRRDWTSVLVEIPSTTSSTASSVVLAIPWRLSANEALAIDLEGESLTDTTTASVDSVSDDDNPPTPVRSFPPPPLLAARLHAIRRPALEPLDTDIVGLDLPLLLAHPSQSPGRMMPSLASKTSARVSQTSSLAVIPPTDASSSKLETSDAALIVREDPAGRVDEQNPVNNGEPIEVDDDDSPSSTSPCSPYPTLRDLVLESSS
ncbi:hypothetical protein BC829DRAFT_442649 [Chytridium lagenaria]|nr:hypothetical protein BC829DRAFT_442649 [Chytridium lagenaria]